jgi:hypothetical protein
MGFFDWLTSKIKPEINIENFDLNNNHYRRELATALNVTPLTLHRADKEFLHENRAVLKSVWDRIQDETETIRSNATPIRRPVQYADTEIVHHHHYGGSSTILLAASLGLLAYHLR